MRKRKSTKWATLAMTGLVSLGYLGPGVAKIMAIGPEVDIFQRFGLPPWVMYYVGAVQVVAAVGLWLTFTPFKGCSVRWLTALGLAVLMVGAITGHVIHDPLKVALPALVYLLFTLSLVYLFRPGAD
jgi:hypothetical protein